MRDLIYVVLDRPRIQIKIVRIRFRLHEPSENKYFSSEQPFCPLFAVRG
jgi:hypothetical protein